MDTTECVATEKTNARAKFILFDVKKACEEVLILSLKICRLTVKEKHISK